MTPSDEHVGKIRNILGPQLLKVLRTVLGDEYDFSPQDITAATREVLHEGFKESALSVKRKYDEEKSGVEKKIKLLEEKTAELNALQAEIKAGKRSMAASRQRLKQFEAPVVGEKMVAATL